MESESPGTGGAERLTRRGLMAGLGAAGMVSLAGCSSDDVAAEPAEPAEKPKADRVVWAVTGARGLTPIEIDKVPGSPVNTPSVTERGRLRVTSDRTDVDGNHRQVWMIPDSDDFTDGEVRTIFWPPSVIDETIATPQMGLAVRLSATRGLIVDQNIAMGAYGYTILAPWSWRKGGGRSRQGPSNDGIRTTSERAPLVTAVMRTSGRTRHNIYLVDRTFEFEKGDEMIVDACFDDSFNGTFTVADVVPTAMKVFPSPAIACEAPSGAAPVNPMMSLGRITRPGSRQRIDPRSLYPCHVALRSIGSRATVKRWRVGDVEPTWDDPTWTVTIDIEGDPLRPRASGGVGVVTNHLRNGCWVEFGDVEIVRYR